jgi:LPXTG-motif cell wall-anchored protein
MLADGTEIPYTSDVAKQTLVVDPKTGFTTGQTAGIAVAAIAAVALLYFITKRR